MRCLKEPTGGKKMYFPYFRGRQYELLALKELADRGLINSMVIPVVEPVKMIPALRNTLTAFRNADFSIGLILNPGVGDLVNEIETIIQLISETDSTTKIIPSVLLNESAKTTTLRLVENNISVGDFLTILNNRDYMDIYRNLFSGNLPKYTLCPDERMIRRSINQNKVIFEDHFNKQSRNADYPEDEFFSDDHLFYKDDNYLGFGDYSIVGDEYIESGFAPYAVAIHIIYFEQDRSLRIKHFISDTNDDISDVAGKFYEALKKLHNWYIDGHENQITAGLQTLLDHYENKTYPGLPTLKKLSIMHHLELVAKFLDGRRDI